MLLRNRAEEIVDMVDKLEAEFRSMEETISGDIYIGGGETDAMKQIARVVKEFTITLSKYTLSPIQRKRR